MQGKGKKKKLILKKWVRIFLIMVLFFLACISLYEIYFGLFPKKDLNPYYNYNIKQDIDYKVYLKPNEFYEEDYLEKEKQYTSQIIDYIDIDFNYLFSGSKLIDVKYDYDIEAQIIGEYDNTSSGKSEIWNKKYILLEKQDFTNDNVTSFDVKNNLKIDYDKYNNVVNNFKNKFKLAIDANLVINLDINYTGLISDSKEEVSGSDTLKISIPLSKSTINIKTEYKDNDSKNLYPEDNMKNMNQVYIGIFMLVVTIIIFVIMKDKLIINRKTYYSKTLEKILKDYSDIIVEISSSVNFQDLEILDIKNFDDMIDIEEELKSPILLYEVEKGRTCWFIVVKNNYAYRYILDSNDI